jgi:secreted trypsin-like serine protease
MTVGVCNNVPTVNKQRNKPMPCKIFYALVRIETDKDVNAITTKIEKLETITSALTLIDVQDIREVDSCDEDSGGPVLYWP